MNVFIFIGLFFAILVTTIIILLLKKEQKPSDIKSNDYMNDPQFSYMSCNKFNPNSPFLKKPIENKPIPKKSFNEEGGYDSKKVLPHNYDLFDGMYGVTTNIYSSSILFKKH